MRDVLESGSAVSELIYGGAYIYGPCRLDPKNKLADNHNSKLHIRSWRKGFMGQSAHMIMMNSVRISQNIGNSIESYCNLD